MSRTPTYCHCGQLSAWDQADAATLVEWIERDEAEAQEQGFGLHGCNWWRWTAQSNCPDCMHAQCKVDLNESCRLISVSA